MNPTDLPLHEMVNGVLTITLNRPKKLNALTFDVYTEIGRLVQEADRDENCKAVVLRGAGRAFSAGFDLKLEMETESLEQKLTAVHDVANATRWAIWNCRKPVIAAIHGYCLAGAFELVLPTDFTIATESCRLGEPEILFGAGPAFLMVPWMTNHKRAKDILLTGRQFSAQEAMEMGFLTRVVADDSLDSELGLLLDTIRKLPPTALWLLKSGINRTYETMGMAPHLNSWAESTLYLSLVNGEVGKEFKNRVLEQGTKAGIAWRDRFFTPSNGAGPTDPEPPA